jgi:hypothetical protein
MHKLLFLDYDERAPVFRRTYCLRYQVEVSYLPCRRRKYVPPKRLLQNINQKTSACILTAVFFLTSVNILGALRRLILYDVNSDASF